MCALLAMWEDSSDTQTEAGFIMDCDRVRAFADRVVFRGANLENGKPQFISSLQSLLM